MYIQQLYTNCLAEAAYYIESAGEAAVIDPLRETEPYIQLAQERGARIKYVLETHFHADFVSGHIDLARETGAEIVYGPNAKAGYAIRVAADGERLPLGKLTLEVLHTPGHTLESSTYLLREESGQPHAIFTGDTLFMGDVGRPDLAVKNGELSKEDLAGLLFDSLQQKILPLPDEVIVYPGHGEGSACGKNIGSERYSTLGEQRAANYALQFDDKDAFIRALTQDLPEPPQYFFHDARVNKEGYEAIQNVMDSNARGLSPGQVEEARQNGVLILDTRPADAFEQGHIPGALNIGLDGGYAVWVGTLLEPQQEMIVVADEARTDEAILRLARVGYETIRGYLKGGMAAWQQAGKPVATTNSITAQEFLSKFQNQQPASGTILDVRRPPEFEDGHVHGATNIPLNELERKLDQLNAGQPIYVHCAGGYRSMIASSMLQQKGYRQVYNIKGGYKAIDELQPA